MRFQEIVFDYGSNSKRCHFHAIKSNDQINKTMLKHIFSESHKWQVLSGQLQKQRLVFQDF